MSFYITTPIYYVNAAPHIGTVYTTLVCDVIARFKRLEGQKVRFLTGTDEHGAKIEKSARDKGVDPQHQIAFNGGNYTLYKKNVLSEHVTKWTRFISLKDAFAVIESRKTIIKTWFRWLRT